MGQAERSHSKRKMKMSLQLKLTALIILIIFIVIALQSTIIGIAGLYLDHTTLINLASAIFTILIGATGTYFIIHFLIKKPLKKFTEFAEHLSANDFTYSINVKSGDEFEQLSHSFNEMSRNMRQLIEEIQNTSLSVEEQNNIVKNHSYEVQLSSEQISATMQELASGSEQQASSSSELSSVMDGFLKRIVELTTDSQEISGHSHQVLEMTSKGKECMEQSVSDMNSINLIVQDSVEKVEKLDSQTQEISSLIAVIQEIAEQTNLLALNAAIEAARAGEHGKGFSVVASEVRKLAEQVSNSIGNITNIVNTVQKDSSEVVTSLKQGYKRVATGTEQIKVTEGTFVQMNDLVRNMVDKIEHITNTMVTIESDGKNVQHHVTDIASISQEAAAGIEETSATSLQTASAIEQVAHKTTSMKESVEQLNTLVKRFKV